MATKHSEGAGKAGPSALATLGWVFIGVVAGAAAGFGIGLVAGLLISEATSMSCFEGACGYFAVFLALIGLVVGAIAGCILAVRFGRRR